MMIAETYNNVWGYTCNPYNRNCSSGGSSGGESALLAMKGQCFELNAYVLLQLILAPLLKAPPLALVQTLVVLFEFPHLCVVSIA